MAECTSLPSCTLPWLRRTHNKANVPIPKVLYSGVLERKLLCGKHELIGRLPLQKYNTGYPFICTGVKGGHHLKRNNLRRCWFGTLTNPENLTPSDWFPVMDELLLTVSIVLAYMAGVVPSRKSLFNARKKQVGQDIGVEDYTASGRAAERGSQTNASDSWSEVKRKLTDALDGFEHVGNLDKKVVDCENCSTNSSLSLFAIAKGPRLRLLWVTLQRLHNEVISTSQTYEVVSRDFWLSVSCQIIQRMIQPICMEWLEYELSLEKDKQDKELVAKAFKKLWENDSMLQRFKELGKAELYADLLFFLRFGFLSDGHNFGDRFLSEHGVDVLEDLVICLADGVSSMYLELISVDSNMTNEMNSLGLHLCFLSTRELQRIRNEVALKQWMQQNFESIVSMYEDRFDLFVLQTKCLQKPSQMEIQEHNWWQKFAFNKPKSDFLHYVWISQMHVHVKRTKELRALTGWRYYFSLFLELSDVAMPLFRVVFTKASNAVSFFLTSLIGRSLGLIYTGIRQSLGWRFDLFLQKSLGKSVHRSSWNCSLRGQSRSANDFVGVAYDSYQNAHTFCSLLPLKPELGGS